MATSAAAVPAVRAALTQLIDYAGLFPPAKLDMAAAVSEYTAERDGPFAWMLDRFIVPVSRLAELLEAPPEAAPTALTVIVDATGDSRRWLSRIQWALDKVAEVSANEPLVRVEAIEIALPALQTRRETYDAAVGQFAAARQQAGLDAVPAFVELPRDERWLSELDSALFAMARHGLGAKLRCGGATADAFPDVEEVSAFIDRAVREHRVPFKATAGLHHPIRRRDEQLGVTMHGFLNVLAAAGFALTGKDVAYLQRVLAEEEAQQFSFSERGLSWNDEVLSIDDLRGTRERAFIAYGSCSFSEPTGDLQALGML
jgi:hypothetical protein